MLPLPRSPIYRKLTNTFRGNTGRAGTLGQCNNSGHKMNKNKQINRRSFIGKSLLAAGGTMLLQQWPSILAGRDLGPSKIPIGFQSYTIREMLGKDFAGTLKTMAGFGYKTVEMCSPPGYVNAGFG